MDPNASPILDSRLMIKTRGIYIKGADTGLKFSNHELQTQVLYERPAFKASRRRVHHTRV